jgi:hypothetical protein
MKEVTGDGTAKFRSGVPGRRGPDIPRSITGPSQLDSSHNPVRYPGWAAGRLLTWFHWLTAILIFAALFIGFTMVNWLAGFCGE